MRISASILISQLILIPSIIHASIIRIPADQPTIQAGIYAASDGDTVLIADGTYTGHDNINLELNGKQITVASENGPDATIIDCQNAGIGFYLHEDEVESSVIMGIKIINGLADGETFPLSSGGGICCYNSSPIIFNCKIIGCFAESNGGGLAILYSSAKIIKCDILNNSVAGTGSFTSGGGISISESSNPTILSCIISNNSSEDFAGGVKISWGTTIIENCLIVNNVSNVGPAIYVDSANLTLSSCTISGNSSGGISCEDGNNIYNSIIYGNGSHQIYGNPLVTYSDIEGGFIGEGNIDIDPLFSTGPHGDFYLSSTAGGQQYTSVCINAGNASSESICFQWIPNTICLENFTTTTNHWSDLETVDLGFHFYGVSPTPTPTTTMTPLPSATFTVTPSPTITPPPTSSPYPTSTPYPTWTPQSSPSATQIPTYTPAPTYTENPTFTPANTATPFGTASPTFTPSQSATPTLQTPTNTPIPSFSPYPTNTPQDCAVTGVTIWMPAHAFSPGDSCACIVTVCNATGAVLDAYPLFVILDVYGSFYFAPSFNDYDNYLDEFPSFGKGSTSVVIFPEFQWPSGVGSASGIMLYAAMTNPSINQIFGEWQSWDFAWGE